MVDSPYQLVNAGFLNHQQYFQDTTEKKSCPNGWIWVVQITLALQACRSPKDVYRTQKRLIFFSTLCFPVVWKWKKRQTLLAKSIEKIFGVLPEMMFGMVSPSLLWQILSIKTPKSCSSTLQSWENNHQNPHKKKWPQKMEIPSKWWYWSMRMDKMGVYQIWFPNFNQRKRLVWSCSSSSRLKSEPRKNPGLTFHYTGCSMGILTMVYHNLHLTV